MALRISGNFTPNSFAGTQLSSPQTDFGPIFTRYTDALPAVMTVGVKSYGGKAIAFGTNRQFSTTNDLVNWSSTKLTPLVGTQVNSMIDGEFDNQGNFKFSGRGSHSGYVRAVVFTSSNVFDASPAWTTNFSSPAGGSVNSGGINFILYNHNTETWFGIGSKYDPSGTYYLNTSGTDLLSCNGTNIAASNVIAYQSNFIVYQNANPVIYRIFNGSSPTYTCATGTNSNISIGGIGRSSMAVNGARIASCGNQTFAFSDNGTSFTLATTPVLSGNYQQIAYGNGVFIATSQAFGANGTPLYSVDNGETWNFLPDWDSGLAYYITYDTTTQNFIATNNTNRDVVIFNSNAIKNL